mmetsp:Transcript_887/g.2548  ORF Transcript_887/g.2548 Transcript_887/m.2548 type:complete len:268 (-) Transcript_887:1025-1828(-)
MVLLLAAGGVVENATGVGVELGRHAQAAADGTARGDLGHHGLLAAHLAVLGDVEHALRSLHEAALPWVAVRALVQVTTVAVLCGVGRACGVGLAVLVHPAVGGGGVAAGAAIGLVCRHAVHQHLRGELHLRKGVGPAESLTLRQHEAVGQSACGALRPAAAAILRDVLVDVTTGVRYAVYVANVPRVRRCRCIVLRHGGLHHALGSAVGAFQAGLVEVMMQALATEFGCLGLGAGGGTRRFRLGLHRLGGRHALSAGRALHGARRGP